MCRREEEDCGNMPVTPDGKLALKESMRRKTNQQLQWTRMKPNYSWRNLKSRNPTKVQWWKHLNLLLQLGENGSKKRNLWLRTYLNDSLYIEIYNRLWVRIPTNSNLNSFRTSIKWFIISDKIGFQHSCRVRHRRIFTKVASVTGKSCCSSTRRSTDFYI